MCLDAELFDVIFPEFELTFQTRSNAYKVDLKTYKAHYDKVQGEESVIFKSSSGKSVLVVPKPVKKPDSDYRHINSFMHSTAITKKQKIIFWKTLLGVLSKGLKIQTDKDIVFCLYCHGDGVQHLHGRIENGSQRASNTISYQSSFPNQYKAIF